MVSSFFRSVGPNIKAANRANNVPNAISVVSANSSCSCKGELTAGDLCTWSAAASPASVVRNRNPVPMTTSANPARMVCFAFVRVPNRCGLTRVANRGVLGVLTMIVEREEYRPHTGA